MLSSKRWGRTVPAAPSVEPGTGWASPALGGLTGSVTSQVVASPLRLCCRPKWAPSTAHGGLTISQLAVKRARAVRGMWTQLRRAGEVGAAWTGRHWSHRRGRVGLAWMGTRGLRATPGTGRQDRWGHWCDCTTSAALPKCKTATSNWSGILPPWSLTDDGVSSRLGSGSELICFDHYLVKVITWL